MATAMALDVGASNASRMVGPTVGGLLLAGIGIEGAFLLSAVLYLAAIAATLAVRTRLAPSPGAGAVLGPHLGSGRRSSSPTSGLPRPWS